MNLKPTLLILCALAAMLSACATSSVKKTWKSPACPGPVGKIAVLAIADRGSVRQAFENRFVDQLAEKGSAAVTTFDLLSLSQIKQDKRAAADRLNGSGAEALLILRPIDRTSSYREVRPGGERWAPVVADSDPMGWYGYYSVGFMDLSPTYGSLTEWVFLETVLYDLKTEQRLWSGLTQTKLKEETDRVAEMDPLVSRILAAMRKDGVIR